MIIIKGELNWISTQWKGRGFLFPVSVSSFEDHRNPSRNRTAGRRRSYQGKMKRKRRRRRNRGRRRRERRGECWARRRGPSHLSRAVLWAYRRICSRWWFSGNSIGTNLRGRNCTNRSDRRGIYRWTGPVRSWSLL